MSFSEILGHERQIAVIRRNAVTGQMPPAYLFHGEEGIGKRMIAMELAKAVNCTGEHEPGDSCGVCQDCRNIVSGCHPNISVMALEANPDTGKMRQAITVDQVRAAQDYLSLKAVGEGRKILIVDGAHLMNEEAKNAFLKTLEEPPEMSHVVLVTSRPGSLLATILSRCRAVSFQPLKEGLVAKLLAERAGMDPAEALFVAGMTGGRVGEALSADPADLAERRRYVMDVFEFLPGSSYSGAVKKAEEVSKKEGGLEDLAFFGTLWFRDLLVILLGGDEALAYNRDMGAGLQACASRMTAYRCEEAIGLLKDTGRALERTYNRRLLAEDLFFRLKEETLA